ncbi:MAG: flagellar basal body P-ring formation chaperone FlgA [Bryobacteraceae bacterium]
MSQTADASPGDACIPVAGDRIRGTDLLAAGPRFQDVEPGLDLGSAPVPGLVRVLRPGGPYGGVCFERVTRPIEPEWIKDAMRKALAGQAVRIEILEFSKVRIPDSKIEFPASALSRPPLADPSAAVVWRGRAIYADRRSLPIWARIRLAVKSTYLTAARDLQSGHLVTAEDISEMSGWRFPVFESVEIHPLDVNGLITTRRISAGDRLDLRTLAAPRVVEAGQSIEVRVLGAGTQLTATATAERGGRLGDMIVAKNDQSGKRFRARITGPGQAVVVVAGRR